MHNFFRIIAILIFLQPQLAGAQATLLRVVMSKTDTPELWDQAIADFGKQNPNVKVIKEIAPNSSTQFHDLLTQKFKNRDTRLDVFFMDVIWPSEFASAGWALPLDRFFSSTEQGKFLEPPIIANRYRGQIFGVPLFIDAGLLYYRKDLLEKYRMAPPRDWPELVEQAKSILAAENDPHLVGYSG
jgi:multiple sugar transport system substrate-binding protein